MQRVVLVCFDIFKHFRGSGTVDKIKKYRRDIPRDSFTHLGRRDAPHPTGSGHPDGCSVYKIPRESLSVFLIIILPSCQNMKTIALYLHRYEYSKKHLRGSIQAIILPLAIILTTALWAVSTIA